MLSSIFPISTGEDDDGDGEDDGDGDDSNDNFRVMTVTPLE